MKKRERVTEVTLFLFLDRTRILDHEPNRTKLLTTDSADCPDSSNRSSEALLDLNTFIRGMREIRGSIPIIRNFASRLATQALHFDCKR